MTGAAGATAAGRKEGGRAVLKPRPGVMEIEPYVPGADKGPGGRPAHKLSANESALGASPKAVEAFRAAGASLHLYPDGAASALRDTIADVHGLDATRIVCGAGSDEILQLLARAYLGPDDSIVQTRHGFLVYSLAATACGAKTLMAPELRLTANVDQLLAAVDDATRIVFLANPNNPTGTYISDAEVRRLREALREDILLVVDCAYAEYMDASDYGDPARLVDDFDNIVMTRTFSKIYGLGGLRLGWGYCPAPVADALNRIRGPFNVSAAAIAAGVAAVRDQDFVARNRTHNASERGRLEQRLGGLGCEFVPSAANFILLRPPPESGRTATDAIAFLAERGVIVRGVAAYGLPDWFRVSIGSTEANDAFLSAISDFIEI
ncbi:MAG: histidinol-phosphate transaminase [Pseudomonadota bacterium]